MGWRPATSQVPVPTPTAPPLAFLSQVNGPWSGSGAVGYDLVTIGDIDGDGKDDLIATAPGTTLGFGGLIGISEVRCISGISHQTIWSMAGSGQPGWGIGGGAAQVSDIDQDGIKDFATTDSSMTSPGVYPRWITVRSSLSGAPIYTFQAYTLWSRPGVPLSDLDGDGVGEFIVSNFEYNLVGRVAVHSGATGALLFQMTGSTVGEAFGQGVWPAGDVNGDGLEDVAISADAQTPYVDEIRVFSVTSTGFQLLYSFQSLLHNQLHARGLGDVDGDGISDVVLVESGSPTGLDPIATGPGSLSVVSGATGNILWQRTPPEGLWVFGHTLIGSNNPYANGGVLAALPDVDGDGVRDFAVTGRVDPNFAQSQSYDQHVVMVFSGHDGTLLFKAQENAPSNFGAALAGGDFDGDGLGDLAVGAPDAFIFAGFVRVYRSQTLMEPTVARGTALDVAGEPQDILFVAPQGQGPTSGGPARSVVLPAGTSTQVWLARPPMAPLTPLPHAIFGVVRSGGNFGVFGLPFGAGALCFTPEVFDPFGDPHLFTLTNTFGGFPALLPANHAYLGAFGSPVALMGPIPFPITFWLQGIVADPTRPFPGLAVTNALRVVVR